MEHRRARQARTQASRWACKPAARPLPGPTPQAHRTEEGAIRPTAARRLHAARPPHPHGWGWPGDPLAVPAVRWPARSLGWPGDFAAAPPACRAVGSGSNVGSEYVTRCFCPPEAAPPPRPMKAGSSFRRHRPRGRTRGRPAGARWPAPETLGPPRGGPFFRSSLEGLPRGGGRPAGPARARRRAALLSVPSPRVQEVCRGEA